MGFNIMLDAGSDLPEEVRLADMLDDFSGEPFYPLDAPGMPPPGPDFLREAVALGDPAPQKTKGQKSATNFGPALENLYRNALYKRDFGINVTMKGKLKPAEFVPGHLWGKHHDVGGPTWRCRDAKVLLVGKCLGLQEEAERRNFVGKSSDLLREVLLECGLPQTQFDDWYISNLVRHAHLDPTGGALPAAWIKNCALLLEQELRLIRPSFVLCLGKEASKYLLGDEAGGTSAAAGKVVTRCVRLNRTADEPEAYHTFQLMTCLHPAAVLRTPDSRPALKGTVRRFVQLLKGELDPEGELEKPDHGVIWTEAELKQTVDDVIAEHERSGRPSLKIALDCEWHGAFWTSDTRPLKELPVGKKFSKRFGNRQVNPEKEEKESWLRTVQFSVKPGWARTIVLRHGGRRDPHGNDRVGTVAFVPGIQAALAQLKRLVTPTPTKQVRLIGHNLKADLPWLHRLDNELGELLFGLFDAAKTPAEARDFGGFDTMYGMHAIQETSERKLELVGANLCGVRRYDGGVIKEKENLCEHLDIKASQLPGYGEITDEVLHPYGNWDVDTTIRIEHEMTKPGGLLDSDQYRNPSWVPFWLSQRKLTAELEMEMTGLYVDHRRAEMLASVYRDAGIRLLEQLRKLIGWPTYNPNSHHHTKCVLYGPKLAGKLNKSGDPEDPRPPEWRNCVVLNLTPVKSSGKPSQPWEKVVARKQTEDYAPSCDKESLGILLARAMEANHDVARDILKTLRWYRFVNRVLTGVLCPPGEGAEVQYDEDGDMIFEKGFMASVEWDHRVRTHFLPVDTGRVSSARPNIQNLSKRREADLKKILETKYLFPLRAMIKAARPGYVLVEADFTGAELMMMAVQSGSEKMVDHCQRANLPKGDPRLYDIHSTVAVEAFQLTVTDYKHPDGKTASEILKLPVGAKLPASKAALAAIGCEYMRDIAKTIAFGIPYGRGDQAVVRAVEELGIKITAEDVANIRGVIFGNYPELEEFFERCQGRVTKPGWMRSCYGRYRRFQDSGGQSDVLAEQQRQAGNFPIQGGVADCTTIAMHHMRHYPGRQLSNGEYRYYMVAQIHDALMSEVRVQDLEWYIQEVIPNCMEQGVTIYACDLNGHRLPNRPGYHLGQEWGIYEYWGEKLSRDRGLELGVPAIFLPQDKK